MRAVTSSAMFALLVSLPLTGQPPGRDTTYTVVPSPKAEPAPPEEPRPEDKTLVAALDVEQGEGKDRVSLYRDGTLALVRTYLGVRTVRKRLLSEEEVDVVARVCSEALRLDVTDYRLGSLGATNPRRFRVEIGQAKGLPRVFSFDELARIPLVLGRARGALEELLQRFDGSAATSSGGQWDPAGLRSGDVLTRRDDGRRYRIVRDDSFIGSLELLEAERGLLRLVVLRAEVPAVFFAPGTDGREREPER